MNKFELIAIVICAAFFVGAAILEKFFRKKASVLMKNGAGETAGDTAEETNTETEEEAVEETVLETEKKTVPETGGELKRAKTARTVASLVACAFAAAVFGILVFTGASHSFQLAALFGMLLLLIV